VLVNLSFAMPAESFLKQLPIHGYAMNPPLSFSASAVVPVVASAQRNGAFVEFDLDCEVPSVVASAVSIVFINSRYYSEPAAGTQWAYYYGDYGESISSASLQSVICSSANNSGCQFRALVEFQCPAAAPASANLGPYIRWEYPPPGTTFTLQGGLQYYTSHGGVRYVTGIDPAVIFGIGGGRLLTANVSGLACFTTSFDLVSDRQNTWIYGNPSFGVPDFANHVNQVVGSLSLSNV
jgi:hypothetical protein